MTKLKDEAPGGATHAATHSADRESSAVADSLLSLLRASSRHAHHALEQTQLMRGLLAPSLSLTHYRQVLWVLAEFYYHVDACFEAQPLTASVFGDYQYYPRYPLLIGDLKQLRASQWVAVKPQPRLPGWRECFLQASSDDRQAWLIGMAYVVEGSAQGGRIIAPRVARTLNINASQGLRFFSAQIETSERWQALLHRLTEPDTPFREHHKTLACQAANRMFSYLQSLAETTVIGDLPHESARPSITD